MSLSNMLLMIELIKKKYIKNFNPKKKVIKRYKIQLLFKRDLLKKLG